MTSTFTTGKAKLEKPANGDFAGTWNTPVNTNMDVADAVVSATTTLTLSNANVNLTATQMQVARILLQGTLTANVSVNFLSGVAGQFIIDNRTSGAFSVTVKTQAVGSTGITAPQNFRSWVFSDGSNVNLADDGVALPQPGSITNSLLANMAANTIKGNLTGGSASPSDNTVASVASALGSSFPELGAALGLAITNGAAPNTQISVTCTKVVLANSAGTASVSRSNISKTISTGASGAAGLDTGSLAANTWYYVYLIDNGTTTAGLISASATSPTLPSGYVYFLRVGAMRVDGSLNLKRTLQKGNGAQYVVTASTNTSALPIMASGLAGATDTPTWVAVTIGSFAPPTAVRICGTLATNNVAAFASSNAIVAPNNAYGAAGSTTNPPPTALTQGAGAVPFDFVLESTNIYWASTAAGAVLAARGWVDSVPAT